jgi:hypothetical protein
MHRGEQICIAIQQRDSEMLRRIADRAGREEDRIFVALLAAPELQEARKQT